MFKAPKEQNSLENVMFFNISENHKKMVMKLKHMDLDAILRPFWAHLRVLWRPLGAYLGVLGPI